MLSLCRCRRAFSSCGEGELLSTCGVWASLAAERRFWSAGSVTGVPALLSWAMWDLPSPGIECVSTALAGGFLTPGPSGKSWCVYFSVEVLISHHRSYAFCAQLLSCVWLYVTLWTVAHGTFQARILEWVAISFSRGSSSSHTRDWNCASSVSCIGRQTLHHWAVWEANTFLVRVTSRYFIAIFN